MADEAAPAQASADSGVTRSPTGEITSPPQNQTTTQSEPSTTNKEAQATEGDKSLLNDKAKQSEGAPKEYNDYTVPEGFKLDPDIKSEADKIFKSMNLSQDQAQELVNFYAAKTKEAFNAPFEAYQDTRKEWRQQAESDPDLRGKLGPGGEVLTTVAKALDGLGDPKLASDFREAMDLTGAGDNPAFIKAFYRMAQRLTEGSHVVGRGPSEHGQQRPGSAAARSPAQDLWPNLPSSARG
jgi:antitoxin component of RelBE/YafQ-DinJ toxin-antitoxin module